jgi:acyl carrier protein
MSKESLKEELRSLISEIAEVDAIPDDTHFKDLGIDSMMGVEIVAAIERQYKVKFDDQELAEVSTLNRSYALVVSKLPQATAQKTAAAG